MAERELIDRKQGVEVVSNGFDRWHMINLLASQESIPTITEQEIVKPYLDKIRAEIEQLRLHKAQFLTNDNKVCIDSQERCLIFLTNTRQKARAKNEQKYKEDGFLR